MRKKICVFTGTRAEYGLLKPLIFRLNKSSEFQLQLLVSGMHMSPEFGHTYKEIVEDGFKIDESVEILLSSDTAEGISKSIGLGVISFSDSLKRLSPDMVIILLMGYFILSPHTHTHQYILLQSRYFGVRVFT